MTALPAPSNHPIFLLAEHLDMLLAAIEDLESCKPVAAPSSPQLSGATARVSLADYAAALHHCELIAISHATRARALTRVLVRRDKRFAMLGGLFVAGTAALNDAVARLSDKPGTDFTTGGDPLSYLRSRAMIDVDDGALKPDEIPEVDETFQLAGEIEIGPLAELVATFLNTIELHFDLFPDISEPEEPMLDATLPRPGELVI